MKQRLKQLLRHAAIGLVIGGEDLGAASFGRPQQLSLAQGWSARPQHLPRRSFEEVGFDVYSSSWEDGILLYVFTMIGMTDRRCVDLGCGTPKGSNVANLIVNHGFSGLLVDASRHSIEVTRSTYAAHPATVANRPTIVESFVTAENVNELVTSNGMRGEIDLLSIDLDGVDWWIWRALEAVRPRVVVVEYQDILGPERSWTVPYDPAFNAAAHPVNRDRMNYCGASLRAWQRLAIDKGYRLVGCNHGGWNAFFIRDGIGADVLPEVSVESCLTSSWNRWGLENRFPLVRELEWVEV